MILYISEYVPNISHGREWLSWWYLEQSLAGGMLCSVALASFLYTVVLGGFSFPWNGFPKSDFLEEV